VLAGTAEGRCDDFEIELSIESEEEPEKIAELIRLAHQMCFTEDALTGKVRLSKTHRLNGKPME
jgi:organic hydroperoxide reductase OsmC/OhrA